MGPSNISGTAEDTNFKFCMRIDRKGYYTKNEKLVKRGLAHVTYFQILGPPNISETAEKTTLKFCMRIDCKKY